LRITPDTPDVAHGSVRADILRSFVIAPLMVGGTFRSHQIRHSEAKPMNRRTKSLAA
jgi:hypothetical protein